jgi:hypothetical protein
MFHSWFWDMFCELEGMIYDCDEVLAEIWYLF